MTKFNKSGLTKPSKQAGVVLFITLVALVIMMIACVALIRSTDTNLLISGNLSFKKDVINQAERAVLSIKNKFSAGNLFPSSDPKGLDDSITGNNYYATIQASNSASIPTILLNTSSFDATMPNNNIVDTGNMVTIRYMIDRMCLETGEVDSGKCIVAASSTASGSDLSGSNNRSERKLSVKGGAVVYRLSIRATGPRNTEAFVQTLFAM